jgi:hypothetical protein
MKNACFLKTIAKKSLRRRNGAAGIFEYNLII